MDIQIQIDDNGKIYTSGDIVSGKIYISCAQGITVSKLAVNLIGESTSSLTGAPGLLFSRREEERHIIVREEYRIIPRECIPRADKSEPIRLASGCHTFDFTLRVPWVQDCSSCLSDPSTEGSVGYTSLSDGCSDGQPLPPSTKDLQKGNEVNYHVDATVTTLRNMFKSKTTKSLPLTIWPNDTLTPQHDARSSFNTATTTARATILGPSSLPLPLNLQANEIHGLGPAEILISATFQPEYRLTRSSSNRSLLSNPRKIALNLLVTRLNHHPQDLYLQSFQMLLVGYTDIQAGAAAHGNMSFWTLQSRSNIGLRVFTNLDVLGTQHHIDPKLWNSVELDESVVPNFTTCNLERRYELEILMGWQCRSGEHAGRVFFVQVRTPVRINSGLLSGSQYGKSGIGSLKDDLQPARSLSSEPLSFMHGEVNAPPTYDEAVRTAVVNGLEGFEPRNASGW